MRQDIKKTTFREQVEPIISRLFRDCKGLNETGKRAVFRAEFEKFGLTGKPKMAAARIWNNEMNRQKKEQEQKQEQEKNWIKVKTLF
jgi:hypothetical protein